MLGQSLSSILGTNFSGSTSFQMNPDSFGGLRDQLLLLKVNEKEYWLLELRFLDVEFGMLDISFAKITAQGRAEIPEAGFEQGPVDMAKVGGVENLELLYGDGLCLADSTTSATQPSCANRLEFAFGFDGTVADIDSKVSLSTQVMISRENQPPK